ncbi:MAG: trigger factor [bacterium]|nr:MAG: trigger factor [bacterium]
MKNVQNIKSELKRLDNGNLEISYTIPAEVILKAKSEALIEYAKTAVIAGFRKGKAPIAKVEENVSEEGLTEHILNHLLPNAFTKSVEEHKFKPAMYPKFEAHKITSSKNVADNTEWQIKAVTCELPEVKIDKDLKKKLSKDPKDQNVLIKSIVEQVNLKIPRLLIEEEVNGRLSQVLDRIEKLGLTLEGYLKSVGKTPEGLRKEYEDQAFEAISLELILNEVSNSQKIDVSESEIDDFIKTTGEDKTKVGAEQRKVLKRVILRRKALEFLEK